MWMKETVYLQNQTKDTRNNLQMDHMIFYRDLIGAVGRKSKLILGG